MTVEFLLSRRLREVGQEPQHLVNTWALSLATEGAAMAAEVAAEVAAAAVAAVVMDHEEVMIDTMPAMTLTPVLAAVAVAAA